MSHSLVFIRFQCEEPTPVPTTLTTVVTTVFFFRGEERDIYIEREREKKEGFSMKRSQKVKSAKISQISQILPKKNFFVHIGQIENKSKKGAESGLFG